MAGFKPHGDNVVIEVCERKNQTSSGIIFEGREHPFYAKGKVMSIGPGVKDEKGNVFPAEFKEDDYVLYDKRGGVETYMGYLLIKVQSVIAIVDKDTEIS